MNILGKNETLLHTVEQKSDTMSHLKLRQQAALRHLISGKSISAAGRDAHVGRTSIHKWLKEPAFAQALTEAQSRLRADDQQTSELNAFREAQATPLLSAQGLRARMTLLDQLLLRDLQESDQRRARLIGRLESSINQAQAFLDRLSADEVARDMVEQRTVAYRRAVLRVVGELLRPLATRDEMLAKFRKKLDSIDEVSGVCE